MGCLDWFCVFKQKTAYEMRISDWSSDVCSSDLPERQIFDAARVDREIVRADDAKTLPDDHLEFAADRVIFRCRAEVRRNPRRPVKRALDLRSEEHTSELQSLMRISYAVFCLKKKKKNTHYRY